MSKKKEMSELEQAENSLIEAAGHVGVVRVLEVTAMALVGDQTGPATEKLKDVLDIIHAAKQRKMDT